MIDFTDVSDIDIKSMMSLLSHSFDGSRKHIDLYGPGTGIMQPIKSVGVAEKVYPGWEGIDHPTYLPSGEEIRVGSISLREKVIDFQEVSVAKDFLKRQLKKASVANMDSAVGEVKGLMVERFFDAFFRGFLEYITSNPGQWGVLPENYDCLTWDGLPFFDNTHFPDQAGASTLDNIVTQTGILAEDIDNDFWKGWEQLSKGKIPGTSLYYWNAVQETELNVIIVYPPELNAVIKKTFKSDIFPGMVAGNLYDAAATNINATSLRPVFIQSAELSELSSTEWYVFFSSKDIGTAPAPVQIFFAPDQNLEGGTITSNAPTEISMSGIGGFIEFNWLGKGSYNWVKQKKAIMEANTYVGYFGSVPFRGFKVA